MFVFFTVEEPQEMGDGEEEGDMGSTYFLQYLLYHAYWLHTHIKALRFRSCLSLFLGSEDCLFCAISNFSSCVPCGLYLHVDLLLLSSFNSRQLH